MDERGTKWTEVGDEKLGKRSRISSQNDEIRGSDEISGKFRAQNSKRKGENKRDVDSSRAKLKVRGFDSGEGALETATTSKEGSRRANYTIPVRGCSDEK